MKWILAAILSIFAVGCAHPRHTAVTIDAGLYTVLNAVHEGEQRALCGQPSCAGVVARVTDGWTDAKSQNFNKQLLPAVESGREFNTVLATWNQNQPVPARVHDLITGLTASLATVTSDFPDGTTKTAILANLAKAQSIALTALDLVLTVKGGGN